MTDGLFGRWFGSIIRGDGGGGRVGGMGGSREERRQQGSKAAVRIGR